MTLGEDEFFEAITELIAIKDAAKKAEEVWLDDHPEVVAKLAALACFECRT